MRDGIHPEYHQITVKCSCGNVFQTGSCLESDALSVEVCSSCHPFFTGEQKIIDSAGRVDSFVRRYGGTTTAEGDNSEA